MVKVIEEKSVPKAKITCNNCESILEYGKEIESVLPCVVKDGIIYDKIKDKIKELRNEV